MPAFKHGQRLFQGHLNAGIKFESAIEVHCASHPVPGNSVLLVPTSGRLTDLAHLTIGVTRFVP